MQTKDLKIGDRYIDEKGEPMIVGTNHLGQVIMIKEKFLLKKFML